MTDSPLIHPRTKIYPCSTHVVLLIVIVTTVRWLPKHLIVVAGYKICQRHMPVEVGHGIWWDCPPLYHGCMSRGQCVVHTLQELDEVLHHFLDKIQQEDESLIAASDDICGNYGLFPSFRKMAEGRARAANLESDVQNAMNRWRKIRISDLSDPQSDIRYLRSQTRYQISQIPNQMSDLSDPQPDVRSLRSPIRCQISQIPNQMSDLSDPQLDIRSQIPNQMSDLSDPQSDI